MCGLVGIYLNNNSNSSKENSIKQVDSLQNFALPKPRNESSENLLKRNQRKRSQDNDDFR